MVYGVVFYYFRMWHHCDLSASSIMHVLHSTFQIRFVNSEKMKVIVDDFPNNLYSKSYGTLRTKSFKSPVPCPANHTLTYRRYKLKPFRACITKLATWDHFPNTFLVTYMRNYTKYSDPQPNGTHISSFRADPMMNTQRFKDNKSCVILCHPHNEKVFK